jgi:hypothetical protein
MISNSQQPSSVRLELMGQIESNTLIDVLKADGRVTDNNTSQKMFVAEASDYLHDSNQNKTNDILRNGDSVLLLNVTQSK